MIIIATIAAFAAAAVIGFLFIRAVHFFIMYFWLYRYLFRRALRYIKANGRGADDRANLTAIFKNEQWRIRATILIPMILMVAIVACVVALLRADILPMPVAVAISIGFLLACFGFIWVFICIEQDGRMYCGRVTEISWSTKRFQLEVEPDHSVEFSCPESKIDDNFLVCGKKYLVGNFTYGWDMAPCDYYEWNDRKVPG